MEITIMGIIVLICITVMMLIGAYSISKWKGRGMVLVGTGTILCSTVSMILVMSHILIRPERERNLRHDGYKAGTEQKYIQRIDTVWVPVNQNKVL